MESPTILLKKRGEPLKNKLRPTKVHVWAGIRGATLICIFDGIMDAE